ncbi:threonylcarbamoyl-AMP synthase [Candidatus Woesearchaeota archaeon]|nr:threonylcarbamoyl-AMP synthase [Candidatus Woesearchaeota archaeon]
MDILTKDEFHVNFEDIKMQIEEGCVFIHPTDTIYGIGCDATHKDAIRKIRDIKDRHESPFSVIAPGKEWILENCHINNGAKEWINKLPGPYTLIFKLRNKGCIAANVNFDLDSLGVRIPEHWFSGAVSKLGKPIVTTSANKSGEDFMTSLDNLNPEVENNTDFILYEEEKHGRPSTIVDLTKEEPKIIRR